jgi:hypothetical protein
MNKVLEVKIDSAPKEILEKVKVEAGRNGLFFDGDETKGGFSGHGIEGNYEICDGILKLTVSKKPLIAPWSLIESKVRSYLSSI